WEQAMLEEINGFRAHPGTFIADDGPLTSIPPSQPLAFDPLLIQAARLHSQDMHDRNYFNHVNPEGLGYDQRIRATGFVPTNDAESIAGGLLSPDDAVSGLINDYGNPVGGHRRMLLAVDDFFKPLGQVGIGAAIDYVNGVNNYTIVTAAD